MSDTFNVAPETLDKASNCFLDKDPELASIIESAKEQLRSLGDVCGQDEPGRRFAASYGPHEQAVLRNLDELPGGLGRISQGLTTMAANYRNAEQASTVDFERGSGGDTCR